MEYQEFLERKITLAQMRGFVVDDVDINPFLKPHQRDTVRWMILNGRAACFESFGLGKTVIQLEVVRLVMAKTSGKGLIVIPLGVRQEFIHDAELLGSKVKFIRRIEEIEGDDVIYLTNYETIRDGKIDPTEFTVASLDEAAALRGMGGTKTFREFMATFAGDRKTMDSRVRNEAVPYRFVATATPSPNDYIELLAYSAFLGIMDVGGAKTRFFKRDSTKADNLTIHPHKQKEFWLWVSSWALFVQRPSDLGHSDDGYIMPEMEIVWHEIPADHSQAGHDHRGQGLMFKSQAQGLSGAAQEKRESLPERVEMAARIASEAVENDQVLIWCDLNTEQNEIEKALKREGITFSSLRGSQDIDERDELMSRWKGKKTQVFLSKPSMYGAGMNAQQSHTEIFSGIGFKFADIFQGIHRVQRFGQLHQVTIHFIYTESERRIKQILETKWQKHKETVAKMTEIIKEYGLSNAAMAEHLLRGMGVERIEVTGKKYTLVNNDCVTETKTMAEDSLDMILTSIPFSMQYEYSPNYADFGHTDNNEHFFKQMDFLTPELFRTLKPGRIAAIHVKDRIVPGGLTGLGFQTVYPFHSRAIEHYIKHGFGYMGMITVVTDVVRENNQTYRLGWTEVCKDGSKMSCGMPEYILLFRKPQTSNEKAYADEPVTKTKDDYTRSRWQTDAHGFWRSSGNRLITPEEIEGLDHATIFQWFRDYNMNNIYDYEHHVKIGESMDVQGRLPVTFMLLQPPSWMDDVWTDVARMRTLNMVQAQKGKEQHLCPMQEDIAKRLIERFSNTGETIFDPFAGIGSVPFYAVKKGRKGLGCELSSKYFMDSCYHLRSAELEQAQPDLFSIIKAEEDKPNNFEEITGAKS